MLAMAETTPGKDGGEVVSPVTVAIAEVTGHQDHGGIKQAFSSLVAGLQLLQQSTECLNEFDLHLAAGGEFFGFLAMVGKIVVHSKGHQADSACGISHQREMDHVDHQLKFRLLLLVVVDVAGFRADGFWFGTVHPFPCHLELSFHIPHGLKVFLNPLAIRAADVLIQAFGAIADKVKHAATLIDPAKVRIHLGWGCSQEKLLENRRWTIHGRNGHAVGGHRQ